LLTQAVEVAFVGAICDNNASHLTSFR
jgi:hypothetical protein